MASIALDTLDRDIAKTQHTATSTEFKDPYNFAYFLGLVSVLALPTLPAILTWIKVMGGYSF